jgi:lactose/L-arabinose transport system substrate-binding protein
MTDKREHDDHGTRSLWDKPMSRRLLLKTAAATAGGVAVGGALAACSPGSSAPAKLSASAAPSDIRGELTLWEGRDDLAKVFQTVIPSFNAKYPNVKVNMTVVDVGKKLAPALISGAGLPDGSSLEDASVAGQAEHLLDLSTLMKPHLADTVQFKVDVNTIKGRLVGIPWDTDPGLLYYREDILTDAGYTIDKINSYDDLLAAARAIKAKNPKARPIPLESDPALGMLWLTMLVQQQQGNGLVDSSGKLTIETDAFHKALTWIKAVADEELGSRQAFASAASVAEYENGTMSLAPWAIWWIFQLPALFKTSVGKWRVGSLPAWTPGGARSGIMGGSSFVIPAKSKNPQLAWLFYEHLVYSPDGYKAVFGPTTANPNGLNTTMPSVKAALQSTDSLYKPISQMGNQPLWEIDRTAALAIPPGFQIPAWNNDAANYLGSNLQLLMDGKMSVNDVIGKSAQDIQKNLVDRQ